MIEINNKEYTGFWAGFLAWFVTAWVFLLIGAIFLIVILFLFSPILIPLGLGILIGKIF